MNVSVIIVNYNTGKLTLDCINSIFEYSENISFEVIVVDNGSTDGSADFFNKDKRITFVQSDINLGFGRANNLGYSFSHGGYIFLLNSDTIIRNNALKIFSDKMDSLSDNIGCLGTFLKDAEGHNTHSYGSFPNWRDSLKKRSPIDNGCEIICDNDLIVDYITGADLFIRRSAIEKVGFFDPDFFLYYEETDLQYRFRHAGYKSMVFKGPEIYHLEGASSKISFRKKMNITKSYLLYFKKRMPVLHYFIFRFFLFFRRFPGVFRNNSITEIIEHIRLLLNYKLL